MFLKDLLYSAKIIEKKLLKMKITLFSWPSVQEVKAQPTNFISEL